MSRFTKWLAAFAVLSVLSSVAQAGNLSCASHKGYTAADFSQSLLSLTGPKKSDGLRSIKNLGIKTVIRYYDYSNDSLFCKSLTPLETKEILKAGLSIVTVFQSGGADPEDFMIAGQGAKDARRALQMAKANGQPEGSAIYFAVDGVDQRIKDLAFEYSMSDGRSISKKRSRKLLRADRTQKLHFKYYARYLRYHRSVFKKKGSAVAAHDMMPFVARYFSGVKKQFGGRYKIGVYGSGQTCEHVRSRGLADYCWLAMSDKWPGTQSVKSKGRWHIAQAEPTSCSNWRYRGVEKVNFDFDRLNSSNVGQWSKQAGSDGLSAQSICSNPALARYFKSEAEPQLAKLKDAKIIPAHDVQEPNSEVLKTVKLLQKKKLNITAHEKVATLPVKAKTPETKPTVLAETNKAKTKLTAPEVTKKVKTKPAKLVVAKKVETIPAASVAAKKVVAKPTATVVAKKSVATVAKPIAKLEPIIEIVEPKSATQLAPVKTQAVKVIAKKKTKTPKITTEKPVAKKS